jgi:hypothetical protein
MPISAKLVQATEDEWARWGFSTRPLHGPATIAGTEKNAPFVAYVNEYWSVVGQPSWNGNTPQPWSAAFISFCFKAAGAAKQFPYASGHFDYCAAMVRSPKKYPGLKLEDPATAVLAVGDLVWAARSGGDCPTPPGTHAKALAALQSGKWFCSHADIVVAARAGEVDVVGGNVSNSVTKVTYVCAGGRIRDPRHTWLGVVKNSI